MTKVLLVNLLLKSLLSLFSFIFSIYISLVLFNVSLYDYPSLDMCGSVSCMVKADGKRAQGRILLSFFVLYPNFS